MENINKQIHWYGNSIIVELIEKRNETCLGKVVGVGTTSTVSLQLEDIVLFNSKHIDSEIEIKGKKLIAIAHWKIFGYIREEADEEEDVENDENFEGNSKL